MSTREPCGIICMAAGKKHNAQINHMQELELMVSTVRKHHPDIPIKVWLESTTPIPGAHIDSIPKLVGDKWWSAYRRAPDTPWRGKFRVINGFKLLAIPAAMECYDMVLWLDGEVRLLGSLDRLIKSNDPFDIAMAKDFGNKGVCDWWNGGVIAIRNTPAAKALISYTWKTWCKENIQSEQAMLSKAIKKFHKEGKIRFKELDHRVWNVRPALASSMPIPERKRVVILHTRGHPFTGDERIWS